MSQHNLVFVNSGRYRPLTLPLGGIGSPSYWDTTVSEEVMEASTRRVFDMCTERDAGLISDEEIRAVREFAKKSS